jgi:DNA-binding CsgD family transcriptional regulator
MAKDHAGSRPSGRHVRWGPDSPLARHGDPETIAWPPSNAHAGGAPLWHGSAIPGDIVGRQAIAATLDLVVGELDPRVATFFIVDDRGEVELIVVHGSYLPPAELAQAVREWKTRLRGIDPLDVAALDRLPGRVASLEDVGGMQRAVLDKGWVRGTYEDIGAINDARMLVRHGERLIAGVSLWRPFPGAPWTDDQLRLLRALQPIVELAYGSDRRAASRIDAGLPRSLTPRQREVARLLAGGATTLDVAQALFISRETAKSHAHAVLTKLDVRSRRELVQRLTNASRASGHPLDDQARSSLPSSALSLEGDATLFPLLEPFLEWSSERIDGTIGGCALFSARLEPAGEAWGGDPLARRVHAQLLSPPGSQLIARLDADSGREPVVQLDGSGPRQIAGRVAELTSSLGMTAPLMAVLRSRGRLAGLVWVCRDASSALDQRASARELRLLHPLLELSHAALTTDRSRRTSVAEAFSRHGLSDRERAVAQMALDGAGNAEIARRLQISESTVKKHMTRVLAKMGVRSRTQLIALLAGTP